MTEQDALPPPHLSQTASSDIDTDTSLLPSSDAARREDGFGSSDGKAESKQKRKRTSPKDQAILESEYRANAKPNKTARAVIVDMVDMTEKEVQIWFQNRRQINRRKSRPLLPHEIAAFGIGGLATLSSDPASALSFTSSQSGGESETIVRKPDLASTVTEEGHASHQEQQIMESRVEEERVEHVPEEIEESLQATQSTLPSSTLPPVPSLKSQSSATDANSSFSTGDGVIKTFSSTPGYLANRWNAISNSMSTPQSSQTMPSFTTPPVSFPTLPSSCPERIGEPSDSSTSSPKMRLSMSMNGKAELVETLSSPPRPLNLRPPSSTSTMPPRRRILQRSQSARQPSRASPNVPQLQRFSSARASQTGPFVPVLTSGRSRDARAWEFCCDPDAQDELTTQATNESSGSAIAAISLLRSTSKAALQPNNNKRNTPSSKQDANKQGKRPKLGRASSSVARLQTTSKPSKDKDNVIWESPSAGDSDKENWLPSEQGTVPRRRPLPSSRPDLKTQPKPVLGENMAVFSHAGNLGGKSKRRKAAPAEPEVFKDGENQAEPTEEVEKFMRGEISPSKKGDYNAIQGLLSLSQGNWR